MEPVQTSLKERVLGELVHEKVWRKLFELVVKDDDELKGKPLEGFDEGDFLARVVKVELVVALGKLFLFEAEDLACFKDIL